MSHLEHGKGKRERRMPERDSRVIYKDGKERGKSEGVKKGGKTGNRKEERRK